MGISGARLLPMSLSADAHGPSAQAQQHVDAQVAGLAELLHGLNLSGYLGAASRWCVDNGADAVDDLPDYADDFVDALGLPRIKRDKLLRAIRGKGDPPAGPPPPPPASDPPPAQRKKRWGDGLECPAEGGERTFFPPGFQLTTEVPEAIRAFGHSDAHINKIMEAGQMKADEMMLPKHASCMFSYTEESPLYKMLNYVMRTAGEEADKQLRKYAQYIKHLVTAANCLPNFVGKVYRGMDMHLPNTVYAEDKVITWQSFSSSSRSQYQARNFVETLPGVKLSGSMFVIEACVAKKIEKFSDYPGEQEVLFLPNASFKVSKRLQAQHEKQVELDQLSAYDMENLDVYILTQLS